MVNHVLLQVYPYFSHLMKFRQLLTVPGVALAYESKAVA